MEDPGSGIRDLAQELPSPTAEAPPARASGESEDLSGRDRGGRGPAAAAGAGGLRAPSRPPAGPQPALAPPSGLCGVGPRRRRRGDRRRRGT